MEKKIDILEIDRQIIENFNKNSRELPNLIEKEKQLKKSYLTLKDNRRKQKIKKELEAMKNKINLVKEDKDKIFYISITCSLLNRYKKILETPEEISFMNYKKKINQEKEQIINNYIDIAKKYIDIDIGVIKDVDNKITCKNCFNKKEFDIKDESIYICKLCGTQEDIMIYSSCYKDIGRINMFTKYTYDQKIHFRDCINQHQAKQNCTVDEKIYKELEREFKNNYLLIGTDKTPRNKRFSKITKEHVRIFLKHLGYSKHYENINLIHYKLTGKKPDDISHLEEKLLSDFDILLEIYSRKFKDNPLFERKSFINTQYVLYQFLLRYKHPCKQEDFSMLKTDDRKSFHDGVASECFQEAGWNHTPLF